MKKLYTFFLAAACSAGIASAQGVDLGVTGFNDPAPGSSIPQSFNDTLTFTVKNFGTALSSGDTVVMAMYLDGVITPGLYYMPLTQTWPSNIPFLVSAPVDLAMHSLTAGVHTICFSTMMPGDANTANDSSCANYNILPPAGIEGAVSETGSIFIASGKLTVDVANPLIAGAAVLTVYNMAGQVVFTKNVSGNGRVSTAADVSNLPAGVYAVRVTTNGNLIESAKVLR